MKKSSKRYGYVDLESDRQASMALLFKLVDMLDDESINMTSCEIRMLLLDAIE